MTSAFARAAIGEFVASETEQQSAQELAKAIETEGQICDQNAAEAKDNLDRCYQAQATIGIVDSEQAKLQLWSTPAPALEAQEDSVGERRGAASAARVAADRGAIPWPPSNVNAQPKNGLRPVNTMRQS